MLLVKRRYRVRGSRANNRAPFVDRRLYRLSPTINLLYAERHLPEKNTDHLIVPLPIGFRGQRGMVGR